MPKFKVVTEPMAEVTLSWNEINRIQEALWFVMDREVDSYMLGEYAKLQDFFGDVIHDMGEAA